MVGTVLVAGGGIAGMRAAVELLGQQFKVYLLEGDASIGTDPAKLDRLFPSGEYAACQLQPLIFELTSNPNATILTGSTLLSVDGGAGDFKVTVSVDRPGEQDSPREMELAVGAVIVELRTQTSGDQTLGGVVLQADGVFVCHAPNEPKDLARSVVQACAAAANAAALLAPVRGTELVETASGAPLSINESDEPKIAVVIDSGEEAVPSVLDLDALCEYTRALPGVECVEMAEPCDDGAQITELLAAGKFNRLVVAGPSPITHEYLYQRYAEDAGLNRYLIEMVNLNRHCAGVHAEDSDAATDKAKALMKMGVARARLLESIGQLTIPITQRALVVGGSAAALACGAKLAEMDLDVELVESAGDLTQLAGNDNTAAAPLLDQCLADDRVNVHTQAKIESVEGRIGDFTVHLVRGTESSEVKVGAIVMATVLDAPKQNEGNPVEEALALRKGEDGFYISTEGALNLLDFDTAGVFNCGPARAALAVEDAIVEGRAAASRAACVIASDSMTRPPTISNVVDENCDGCAYCVDPCPTRSITLLEFMLRGEIKKVVESSERTCIGCGICMSTCPKKGIFVKHYRLEAFADMVNAALEDAGDKPVLITFCCNRCGYPAADAAGLAGLAYPAGVRIIRTVCSGMIHPNVIMDALSQGADGVLVCGCHPGNCRSRDGIRKAIDRAEAIELMLEDFGLEPERFRLEHIAASEGPKFAEVVREMTDQLASLGPNPYRQNS